MTPISEQDNWPDVHDVETIDLGGEYRPAPH